MNFKIGWYPVYVKSRWEKKVHGSLEQIGLEPFLPQFKVIKHWSDRKKQILKPLFPSYVFVKINSFLEFHKALSVNGACAYIQFGNEYPRITEKEINQIKLLIGNSNIKNIETNTNLLKSGDVKMITHGPLNGLECEVIEADNHNKIIVRINSLRKNIEATVPLFYLT